MVPVPAVPIEPPELTVIEPPEFTATAVVIGKPLPLAEAQEGTPADVSCKIFVEPVFPANNVQDAPFQ
jgi:hypothetical protein